MTSVSKYIVSFKKETDQTTIDEHIRETEAASGIKVHPLKALKGYTVEVPDNLISSLSFDHKDIADVEADGEVTTQGKALLKQSTTSEPGLVNTVRS